MPHTFNRGNWETTCALPDWTNEEGYEAWRQRLGYVNSKTIFGVEYGSWIEVYQHDQETSFLACVTPLTDSTFDVHLPDFVSLMMFIKDYGSAYAAQAASEYQQASLALQRRLFKATHGHSPDTHCSKCEPDRDGI